MPTTLQVRFGHEENFSRYLLESGQFEQLLVRAGFAVAGEGALEVPVAKGHEGREGRLDIYQPTTAGVVIGEMQYGTSDGNHRNRFEGYAKSVASPAAIVWVAERFRDKDLQAVAGSKVPVLCVTAKLSAANNIVLTAIGGARLSAQSLQKRAAKASAEAWGWVQGIDWERMAMKDAWSNGFYALGLIEKLVQTDEEWAVSLMSRAGGLGKTAPSARRRMAVVESCSESVQLLEVVLNAVRAAKAQCVQQVDKNEVEEHLAWRRERLAYCEQCTLEFPDWRGSYEREAQGIREEIREIEGKLAQIDSTYIPE